MDDLGNAEGLPVDGSKEFDIEDALGGLCFGNILVLVVCVVDVHFNVRAPNFIEVVHDSSAHCPPIALVVFDII